MSQMGKYCKVYPISALQEFEGWTSILQYDDEEIGTINPNDNADAVEADFSDYVYLQDDYTVTSGLFKDEAVIFNSVTPEWIAFCKDRLKFELPFSESAT
jgi:hypothetical protein